MSNDDSAVTVLVPDKPDTKSDSRAAVLLFMAVALAAAAYEVHLAIHLSVTAEDIRLLQRGLTPRGYVEPYNSHLSIVPVAIYQMLGRILGIGSYLPYLLTGVVSLTALSAALFAIVRDRVGVLIAAAVGISIVLYPAVDLTVASFNHYLAFCGVVVCAWILLAHPGRHNLWLASALSFSLCSSGVSVAGAAGCAAFVVIARSTWKRRAAVFVPIAGWIIWHQTFGTADNQNATVVPHNLVTIVGRGILGSFRGLMFDNRFLGVLLALGFVALLVWRLRQSPRLAVNGLSWTFALLIWWVGLAVSRSGRLQGLPTFRYQLVGSGFIVLAMLPTDRWRPRITAPVQRSALVGVCGLVAVVASANLRSTRAQTNALQSAADCVQRGIVSARKEPGGIPDGGSLNCAFVSLSAGQLRAGLARFGVPHQTLTTNPSRWLIGHGAIATRVTPVAHRAACTLGNFNVATRGPKFLAITTGDTSTTVRGALTGDEPSTVINMGPHATAIVAVRPSALVASWHITAHGVCDTN